MAKLHFFENKKNSPIFLCIIILLVLYNTKRITILSNHPKFS